MPSDADGATVSTVQRPSARRRHPTTATAIRHHTAAVTSVWVWSSVTPTPDGWPGSGSKMIEGASKLWSWVINAPEVVEM